MNSDGDFLISAATAGIALAFALTLPGELNWMLRNIRLVEYKCWLRLPSLITGVTMVNHVIPLVT